MTILAKRPASEKRSARLTRESISARRERMNALLATIRHNRPYWATPAPWRAENYLEGNAGLRQLDLFGAQTELPR
jgi:hypothetical protein